MSLITKFVSVIVKQELDIIIKNLYFKLLADNITLSRLSLMIFFLKKIKNNIKLDALFLNPLTKEVSTIKKVNAITNHKNIFATSYLAIKSMENCHF